MKLKSFILGIISLLICSCNTNAAVHNFEDVIIKKSPHVNARAFTNLSTAKHYAATQGFVSNLFISGAWNVTGPITIPNGMKVEFAPGGRLVKANPGAKITFQKGSVLQAERRLIFSGFSIGDIYLDIEKAYPEWFASMGAAGIREAIGAIKNRGVIELARTAYNDTVQAPVVINFSGLNLRGSSSDRSNTQYNGSVINTTYNGDYIQMGSTYGGENQTPWNSATDYALNSIVVGSDNKVYKSILGTGNINKNPTTDTTYWSDITAADASGYYGYQSHTIKDIYIKYTGSTVTPLNNGKGNYGPSAVAIRDWRGGSIILDNVTFENFKHGFWGVQSDFNHFSNVNSLYCKVGLYFGPRSDQFKIEHYMAMYNDSALIIDGTQGAVDGIYTKDSGSSTDYPINIKQTNYGSKLVTINSSWFEMYPTTAQPAVTSFIGVGVDAGCNDGVNALTCTGSHITGPLLTLNSTSFLTSAQNSSNGYTKYLVGMGRGRVNIQDVAGDHGNIKKLVGFQNNYTMYESVVRFDIPDGYRSLAWELDSSKSGTGTKGIYFEPGWASGGGRVFMGPNNQIISRNNISEPWRDYAIQSTQDRVIQFHLIDSGQADTKHIQFSGRFFTNYVTYDSLPPAETDWNLGDIYTFIWPGEGSVTPAYLGRICNLSGTMGTYTEGLYAASTNGGTTFTLNAPTTKLKPGRWITVATTPTATVCYITAVSGTTVTCKDKPGGNDVTLATGTNLGISYRNPTFRHWGDIGP